MGCLRWSEGDWIEGDRRAPSPGTLVGLLLWVIRRACRVDAGVLAAGRIFCCGVVLELLLLLLWDGSVCHYRLTGNVGRKKNLRPGWIAEKKLSRRDEVTIWCGNMRSFTDATLPVQYWFTLHEWNAISSLRHKAVVEFPGWDWFLGLVGSFSSWRRVGTYIQQGCNGIFSMGDVTCPPGAETMMYLLLDWHICKQDHSQPQLQTWEPEQISGKECLHNNCPRFLLTRLKQIVQLFWSRPDNIGQYLQRYWPWSWMRRWPNAQLGPGLNAVKVTGFVLNLR